MKLAFGTMQIRPADFWEMSLEEFYCAIEGFKEFHAAQKTEPMTRNELETLRELYPDG
jgi:hypothetical protein